MTSWKKRTRSALVSASDEAAHEKRRKTRSGFQLRSVESLLPDKQNALLLHAIRQPYQSTTENPVPEIQHDWELLVKIEAIGLNPIDWKAP